MLVLLERRLDIFSMLSVRATVVSWRTVSSAFRFPDPLRRLVVRRRDATPLWCVRVLDATGASYIHLLFFKYAFVFLETFFFLFFNMFFSSIVLFGIYIDFCPRWCFLFFFSLFFFVLFVFFVFSVFFCLFRSLSLSLLICCSSLFFCIKLFDTFDGFYVFIFVIIYVILFVVISLLSFFFLIVVFLCGFYFCSFCCFFAAYSDSFSFFISRLLFLIFCEFCAGVCL